VLLNRKVVLSRQLRRNRDQQSTAFADPACLKMILDWRDAA